MTISTISEWKIDTSAGAPILTYKNCSVIESEQAEYVLSLIRNAEQPVLAVREAQSVPAPIAFSENADADMCRKWAWEQVKKDVTTDSWTIGDSSNFYGFYCWGWDMRRQYNEQRPPAVPDGYKLVPVELLSTASMLIDLCRTHATLNSGGTYNQRVLSDCETTMNAIAILVAAAPTPTK